MHHQQSPLTNCCPFLQQTNHSGLKTFYKSILWLMLLPISVAHLRRRHYIYSVAMIQTVFILNQQMNKFTEIVNEYHTFLPIVAGNWQLHSILY